MLNQILTGGVITPLLLACGVWLLCYLRAYPFRSPHRLLKALGAKGEGGVSPFRALTEALAGTLGVGNIVGVANAIAVGGAGAIFWMWVSALLASVLKYAEILLAVSHRRERRGEFFGGAYYYIKDHFLSRGMRRTATVLSVLFALLMILNALSMGCVVQVRAVTTALQASFPIPAWGIAAGLLLLTLPLLLRGRRGISALTEYLVPVMAGGYLVLSVAVLILRREHLGTAFSMIFEGATAPTGIGGGLLGFLSARALRVGTMRGLLSNEAGCGTSPTAHAASGAHDPAAQGVWGIFEVLVDTLLLCTVTALVLLVSPEGGSALSEDGMLAVMRAYSSVLGGGTDLFFSVAVFCFGYATLLCWGGYGLESLRFLRAGRPFRMLYLLAFALCTALGVGIAPGRVWDVADFAISALTAVNLLTLVCMRREVRARTLLWAGAE